MRTLITVAMVAALFVSFGATHCPAMISFGYLSPKQAKEHDLHVRYRAAGPDDVWVEVSFATTGRWEHFAEPVQFHYIELALRGADGEQVLRTRLREDRGTKGRLSVSFTVERAKLHQLSVWLVRRVADVADVVQLKDYVPLAQIGRDYKTAP